MTGAGGGLRAAVRRVLAGLCDLASGFPLLASDLGPPTRERFKTPDYPGAKPPRERPLTRYR